MVIGDEPFMVERRSNVMPIGYGWQVANETGAADDARLTRDSR
jgi:hypothetical protein